MLKKSIFFLLFFISIGVIVNIPSAKVPFYPLIFALGIAGVAISPKKKIGAKATFLCALIVILFFILIVLRKEPITFGENIEIVVKVLIVLVLCIYAASRFKDKKDFYAQMVEFFEKLIVFSYYTFVLSNVLTFLVTKIGGITPIGDQYLTFVGLCFGRVSDFKKYGFYRNQSFFWEPGVYGVLIIILYMVKTVYLQQKDKVWKWYVAVFTTLSMGTILIFVAFDIFKNLLSKGKYVFNARLVIFSILITSPIIFVINFLNTYSGFMESLLSTIFHRNIQHDSSLDTRTTDLIYGFKASLDKIYFGHGFDFDDFYALTSADLNTSKKAYNGGITNGIVGLLYCYGIFFLLFFLFLLYKACRDFAGTQPKYTLLLFFTFIGTLMAEPIQFSLFMLFMLTFYSTKRVLKYN